MYVYLDVHLFGAQPATGIGQNAETTEKNEM